ncbi:hypothetical protein DM785_02605 [Deinococcus actinosclerus]|nr:hypothetical protein DM785_02605 [Deinococcus actinosclerus]
MDSGNAQRATLTTLLAQHNGNFPLAYQALAQQFGDLTVPEATAINWAAQLPPSELGSEANHQLQHFIRTGEAPSGQILTRRMTREDMQGAASDLEAGALRLLTDVMNDTKQERFDGKTRASTAVKVVEMFGTADKTRGGTSPGRQAHQNAPQVQHTFGALPDRMVVTQYLREGEDADRLADWLAAADPSLAQINGEFVRRNLQLMHKRGVVMDSVGTLVPWDEACAQLLGLLRIVRSDE